jgi:hypothetical protein
MIRSQIELEVQRRLTEALVAAGVSHGRISLEVLYMLPPEFVEAYTRLFWQAFQEPLRESGSGKGPDGGNTKKKVASTVAQQGVMAPANNGGKRFRTYWTIRNEDAFNRKKAIDRALKRLARKVDMGPGKGVGGDGDDEAGKLCDGCGLDLRPLESASGTRFRYCPHCGGSQSVGGVGSQ